MFRADEVGSRQPSSGNVIDHTSTKRIGWWMPTAAPRDTRGWAG